jgi:hypothetical protein
VSDQQAPVLLGSGTIPVREGPIQVEASAIDALMCTDGIYVNEANPRLENVSGGDASASGSSRSLSSSLPRDATLGPQTLWSQGASS